MCLSNRLNRLEKSRPEVPHILLAYSYGEAEPEVPPGVTATILLEYVVEKVEPDGTAHVVDPRNPDAVIVRRPGEPLPDRSPENKP